MMPKSEKRERGILMAVQEEGAEKKARRPQSGVSLDRCLSLLRRVVDPARIHEYNGPDARGPSLPPRPPA